MSMVCKVCGMIINEKNYKLNEKSVPEENSTEHYKYCPFCGAGREYFSDNKSDIYAVDSNNIDEATKKILRNAVLLETFNGDFYKVAAEKAVNPEIKEMFKGLSNIEYIHAKVHKRLSGIEELPALREINYDKYDTDEKLLKASEEREKHAVEYYIKYSDKVNNETIKRVFEAFIKVEKDHIDLAHK